jgi:putative ATPase
MFVGGEDPLFIARRFVRIAAEDVGLGDPQAVTVAISAMQGCQLIGRPECNVILAQCAVYLARAKKSPEVYNAMNEAVKSIQECDGSLPGVPLHLRNASNRLADQGRHSPTELEGISF